MRFRSEHIADSVAHRIAGIAESVRNNTPLPESKGPSSIQIEKKNGQMLVTKSFENGETELMTISSDTGFAGLKQNTPEGFEDITPEAGAAEAEADAGAVQGGGIVENVASGGDSIDTLLRT